MVSLKNNNFSLTVNFDYILEHLHLVMVQTTAGGGGGEEVGGFNDAKEDESEDDNNACVLQKVPNDEAYRSGSLKANE